MLTLVPTAAHAGRNITLPFEEKFDSGDTWTSDLRWIANGATGTHLTTGGWSGGCARFTPPTSAPGSNGTYSGMGSFTGLNHKTLHIRYLMKIGSTYHLTHQGMVQNKHVILNKTVGTDRGMTMLQKYTDPPYYHTFGAYSNSAGATFYQGGGVQPPPGWPNGNDAFKNTDHLAQWFCIEHAFDLNAGTARVYLWTQNGSLSGQYIQAPKDTVGAYNEVQIIGGYYNGYHTADPDTYIMLDELKIATSFIGPPAGFLSTTPPDAGIPPDTRPPDTSSKPDSSKPDSSKPDSSKPDSSKPDSSKPDSSKPDSSKLDSSSKSDHPLDGPGADAVSFDLPRSDTAGDAPRIDAPRSQSDLGTAQLDGGCGCTVTPRPARLALGWLLLLALGLLRRSVDQWSRNRSRPTIRPFRR